ncbi:MAG: glycosyltransferase family 4 protein [Ardenticatenaceae bacterium]
MLTISHHHLSQINLKQPLRIAYLCADQGVPCFGRKGCSIHVQEVIRALQGQGAQVDLFAARLGGDPPPGLEAVRLHPLPAARELSGAGRPLGNGRGALWTKDGIAAREQVALAANDAVRSTLAREGPFDLIYERYSLWSFAGMEYAWTKGIPGVLEVNAPLIEEQAAHRGLVNRGSAEQVARRVFAAASAIVAVSDEVARYLDRHCAAQDRTHVIPNGVDPERFRPGVPPAFPGTPSTFTIGFVGTLKPWHGLATLIEAFTCLARDDSTVRLLIVGDGPRRAELEQRLAERALRQRAHFPGLVAPAEVPAWLASMDVAVAPYPKLDNFYFSPLKMYEYMAAGVPVVASRTGQLAHVIEDGRNGLFYPPADSAALLAALARLRDDCALRRRLGSAGRATVLREHTWKQVAGRILELGGFNL